MRTYSRCVVSGTVAIAFAFSLGVTVVDAQGVPGSGPNKCLSGKTKCVNSKVAGLLKCREKCQKNPAVNRQGV